MSYTSEVLADSPGLFFLFDDSALEDDTSGNNRDLNVTSGTGPTLAGDGPLTAASASWGASAGFKRTTYTQSSGLGVGTISFLIKIAANPAATLTLAGWSPNSGGDVSCFHVQLLTDGKIRLRGLNTGFSVVSCDSASALTTGAWHHVAVSVGAAGMKIRIDKTNLGSAATTAFASPNVSSFRVHGRYNAGDTDQTGAVQLAAMAWFPTQLSDARTDAQYDAIPPPLITGTLTAAGIIGTPAFTGTYDGPVTGVLDADGIVADPEFTGTYVPPPISGTLSAISPTAGTAFDGVYMPAPVSGTLDATGPQGDAVFDGTYDGPAPTDTSNQLNGRSRGGYAIVTMDMPVIEPTALQPVDLDLAVAYPTPDLVKGVPT